VNKKDLRVIDAHCDTLYELDVQKTSLYTNDLHVSLERLLEYGGYVQVFATWVDDTPENPMQRCMHLIDVFYDELRQNEKHLQLVLSAKDLRDSLYSGKVGALLSVENGRVLEHSIHNLYALYARGVRAMTLTWNGINEIACGASCQEDTGLSAFGREVVQEMNRLGMLVDVSHLSIKSFWDVIAQSTLPVMASHSNAYSVAMHERNLSDRQIQAMIQTNGFIGLTIYPLFLAGCKQASMRDFFKHCDYMLAMGAENNIGLGSDFDGISVLPEGMTSACDYECLCYKMKEHGYTETLIKKITHENFLRYADQVLKG